MSVERRGSQSSEVEDLITAPSIIELLKLVKERDDLTSLDSVQDRFRIACAENDLIEGYMETDWVGVFDKFLSGLKDIRFSQKFASTVDHLGSGLNVHGIYNQNLTVYIPFPDFPEFEEELEEELEDELEEELEEHLKIHFTLIEPKVKDPRLPKKVEILFRRTERYSPTEVEVWYELGNRQLVTALPEDKLIYYNSELEVSQMNFDCTDLCFDEEGHVYFKSPDVGVDNIRVYQTNLRTNSEPVVIHTFQNIYCVMSMGVRGGKLFALVNVRINPNLERRIDCVDLATQKVISVPAAKEIDNKEIIYLENGILFTDLTCRSYVYLLDEDKFVSKVMPSTLRTQLNQCSFVHQREILDSFQLKTFSFVDGKMIENHIGEIDQSAIILRHTDHVFVVLLKKRRYIYYEEKPGTKPILLHTDNTGTPMKQFRHGWAPKEFESHRH